MEKQTWLLTQRILFRFGCIYFLLFTFPSPLDYFVGIEFITRYDTRWASNILTMLQHANRT
ncbi:MAG: hypothetical protein ACK5WO_00990 [Cyclobacteriaceae bacterium]